MSDPAIPPKNQLELFLQFAEKGHTLPPADIRWLAPMIDHTLLKPEATEAQIRALCAEAHEHGFATVCVYPKWLPLCRQLLKGSATKPIAVVGFPTGLNPTSQKVKETKAAVKAGAAEIDMVINVEWLQARKLRRVAQDIRQVVLAAQGKPVKVILETCLLTKEEIAMASALSLATGAAFVKTSTGFSTGGAKAADVELMRECVGLRCGVKASGGIRTTADALRMVLAGANRIGASASVAIVGGSASTSPGY